MSCCTLITLPMEKVDGIFLRKEMKSNDDFNEARRYIMKTKNDGNSQHLYVLNSLFPAWFTQTYMIQFEIRKAMTSYVFLN